MGQLGEQRLGFQLLGGRDALGEQDAAFRSGELAQEEVVRLRLHVHLQASFLAEAAQFSLWGGRWAGNYVLTTESNILARF